jgi:hypothetical protein
MASRDQSSNGETCSSDVRELGIEGRSSGDGERARMVRAVPTVGDEGGFGSGELHCEREESVRWLGLGQGSRALTSATVSFN